MKIALAQINTTVGDFEYNVDKILNAIKNAVKNNAEIIIFHELAICGYSPEDLLLKKQFITDHELALKKIQLESKKISNEVSIIIGIIEENKSEGRPLYNSVAVIQNGEILYTRQKSLLPTYDVFDEDRYFEPGTNFTPIVINGKKIGLTICEDIWHDSHEWAKPRYLFNPVKEICSNGVDLIINCSASPYFIEKPQIREEILKSCAKKHNTPIIYVNQIGGNDELVFDGNSCFINKTGEVAYKLKSFDEDLAVIDIEKDVKKISTPKVEKEEELLNALILGLKDYLSKCGFKKVLLGLSGGIDSALVACIATFALGSENVTCVAMPSKYTSDESNKDAKKLAENLKVDLKVIPIEEPFNTFVKILDPHRKEKKSITEENLQSRIRGLILMALSNETGALVLSTGNKSEVATGYCTLYGDMCGGLSVISDLPKTTVYDLAKHINQKHNSIIPPNILSKEPTAELKPNQKDSDSLPIYETLDKILALYIEENKSPNEIINSGLSKKDVERVCHLLSLSEYKRKQAAPGLKLTSRSFGNGWRMPIAKRYRENNK